MWLSDIDRNHIRCSIVVSISACHAEDPGSIPGGGVSFALSCILDLYLWIIIISSISGLVAEYIVAIDVTRVRFPADASS